MSMYESEIQATLRGVDWRWSEVLDLAPVAIMQELLELDTVILDLFHAYREAKRGLAKAQEDLKMAEDIAVEEAQAQDDLNKGEPGYVSQVEGSNQTVRDRKVRVYLSTHPAVKEARQEVEVLSTVADDAEGALDAMKDRQSNLRQWSRMYVATTELLTSMRPQGEVLAVGGQEVCVLGPDEGLGQTLLNQFGSPGDVVDKSPGEVTLTAHEVAAIYREAMDGLPGDVVAPREESSPRTVGGEPLSEAEVEAVGRYQDVSL